MRPSKTLRNRAERMLRATRTDIDSMSNEDVRKLAHELQVHQMELQIQNEDLRDAQVELAHSRDRYADLYAFAPMGYLTVDRHSVIQEANLTAAAVLGVERKQLVDRKLSDFVADDAQETWHLHRREVFSGETKRTCELEMKVADGDPITVRLESLAFRDDTGNLEQCRVALIDITAVQHARQQLEESELRYRRLTDAVTDYVYQVRVSHGHARETIHGANCQAVTGYTVEEFRKTPLLWIAMVPTEDRAIVEQQVADVLSDKNTPPIEHRIVRKDGQIRWVLNTVSPQHNEQGHLVGYDGLLRDITDRKEVEKSLHELNETLEQRVAEQTREVKLLAEAMANLGEGVMITSDHLNWPGPEIVYVNEAMFRITGYTAEELIGQTPRMLQGEETDKNTIEQIRQALAEKHAHLCELINYRKDGTPYDAEIFITPLFDAAGKHTNFIAIHRDITERKQTEKTLRCSEAQKSAILGSLVAHIAVVDRDGTIVTVNPAWEKFARDNEGSALRCNVGANYLEVCKNATGESAEEAQRVAAGLQAILDGRPKGFSLEYPCHSPAEQRWFLFQATALQGEELGAVVSHTNITERVKAEQSLRESEQRLRAILDTASDAIINIDQCGIITAVNPATEQMFGYPRDELIGQNVKVLMPPLFHDEHDDIARYRKTGEARIIGIGREMIGRRKDGSTFPLELAVSEVEQMGLFTGIIRDISEQRRLQRDVVGIAEDEQRRIGQDLHDSTQQELTGLGMLAHTLFNNLAMESADPAKAKPTDSAQLAKRILDGIARAQQEVQTISRGLVPVRLDGEGLMDALRELASRTDNREGIPCAFKCEQPVEVADSLTATHLYRIAQEAVTNALKHARPEHVLIALESDDGRPVLQIADDGIGFDLTESSEGMGLKTMRYRASLIGANLTVTPVDTGGTLVTCKVFGGAGHD